MQLSRAVRRLSERDIFACALEVRKPINKTNSVESLNASVRKAVRNKVRFPHDQAAIKLIWLALRRITKHCMNPTISCHAAKAEPAIRFDRRILPSKR